MTYVTHTTIKSIAYTKLVTMNRDVLKRRNKREKVFNFACRKIVWENLS